MKKAHNLAPQTIRKPITHRVRLISGLTLLGLLAGIGLAASRPAHTAGGPVPVTVTNSALNTQSHDLDNAALQPFQAATRYVIQAGSSVGVLDTASSSVDIKVPFGKRLVIQTVSEYVAQASSGEVYHTSVLPLSGGFRIPYSLPAVTPDGASLPGVTQSMTLYADPSSTLFWSVRRSGTVGKSSVEVIVCGYLVDMP